jgi:hypothetical protein
MDPQTCRESESKGNQLLQLLEKQRQRAQQVVLAQNARIRLFDQTLHQGLHMLREEIAHWQPQGDEDLDQLWVEYQQKLVQLAAREQDLRQHEEQLQRAEQSAANENTVQLELEEALNELESLRQRNQELQAQLVTDEVANKAFAGQQSFITEVAAADPDAISQVLDQDEVIRTERERLQKLQDEWREKLREMEVQTSLDRAKLARERNEMLARIQALELKLAKHGIDFDLTESTSGKEFGKGRWRAALGIRDTDCT